MSKIIVLGAGSASFGENTLAAILRSKKMSGSSLVLVDHNPKSLDIVYSLAQRLNREWNAGMNITAHPSHKDVLQDADFVVSAIEVGPREELWKSDYEITLRHGVHQPYAENGGPGGFIHAARNIAPLMEILHDMEEACPDAWFINFTNPMVRICDLINRYSRIKVVGLCHQIYAGYGMVGVALANDLGMEVPEGLAGMHADIFQHPLQQMMKHQAIELIDIVAAGTNHFSWMLSVHERNSGRNLYPLFQKRFFELDEAFEPLTRRIFQEFGCFPIPGDTHLCEYLPWMSDPVTKPWEKYNIHLYDWDLMASLRDFSLDRLNEMGKGAMTIDGLMDTDSEGALEIIENIGSGGEHYHLAANLPNIGQISNLPMGAIVETPVMINGSGIHPVHVGALPEPIAELCRRELTTARLGVDAVVEGSHEKALQCLLLDPVIRDIDIAKAILDDYLITYRQYLPQFWK